MASLKHAIPHLRSLFRKKANDTNAFPLFAAKQEKLIWKHTRPSKNREKKAAILVPLVACGGVPSLLFTTRSGHLSSHASEVSFPGGHHDEATDRSPEDTAIREAREELLGEYPWEDALEIVGRASPLPSATGMPVTPVIAVLHQDIEEDTFPGNPSEVQDVFCVSLEELLQRETSQWSDRFRNHVPVFPTANGKRIWGLTAIVTRPLLHKLFKPVFFDA